MIKKMKDPALSLVAGLLGAKGGKARTPAKIKAVRENAKKARAAFMRKHAA